MSLEKQEVVVVCDEESHAPKVARITTFARSESPDGDWTPWGAFQTASADGVVLVEDLPYRIPDAPHGEAHRNRDGLRCPLCDLRVEMRAETTQRVAQAAHAAGMSKLSLSTLAAIL